MLRFTRRTMLAGAAAVAASNLVRISTLRAAPGDLLCLSTIPLHEFLADAEKHTLTSQERIDLVDQATKLLSSFYVHLPFKRALYGADPLEGLRLLQQRLPYMKGDRQFHQKMRDIFDSLHDMHTHYYLPDPYKHAHAWLPFKVEACVEDGRRKYIVSRVVDGFAHPSFKPGVEVLSFNGVPVERAAELAGESAPTPAARHALGLARLTYRWLLQAPPPPPSEEVALIRYSADGQDLDIRVPWSVTEQPFGNCSKRSCGNEVQQLQDFRRFLYAPYDDCRLFGEAETIHTPDGDFGYIRIFSLDKSLPGSDDDFVAQFKRYLEVFAADKKGVIIDVRDNAGGSINRAERCLQFITPTTTTIKPIQFYFIATPVTLQFCALPPPQDPENASVTTLGPKGLRPYIPSIMHALQTDGTFSDRFQYTRDELCNDTSRWAFPGPVVVVTSALTLSAAEFFAAGFQDHGGKILGVDETTSGGGAHVRNQDELHHYFIDAGAPSPFKQLAPNRGEFSVAFRRAVRVGLGAGKEIEDVGVAPNHKYAMTRDDLLYNNRDLKTAAAKLLATMI